MEGGARPGLLPTYLPLGRVDKVSWPPRVRPPRYEVHTHPSYVGRYLTIGYTPTTRYLVPPSRYCSSAVPASYYGRRGPAGWRGSWRLAGGPGAQPHGPGNLEVPTSTKCQESMYA